MYYLAMNAYISLHCQMRGPRGHDTSRIISITHGHGLISNAIPQQKIPGFVKSMIGSKKSA